MTEQAAIYRHESRGRYFYDTQVPNHYGWSDGTLAFRAYTTPEPGTVPIYQHEARKSDQLGYHYDQKPHNVYGWSEGTVAFYAFATQQAGTVPVYQHETGPPYRYFYDTLLDNHYGWSKGFVAFYAYPPQATLADEIGSVLGEQGGKYRGVTYLDTRDNRFTLLDTPHLWDGSPTVTQPIAGCERLLKEIESTIGNARKVVDITLLWQMNTGLPGGGFQAAISAGLKSLTAAERNPYVRIMIGVNLGPWVLAADLRKWLQATIELNNNQKLADVRFPIVIGCCKQSPESWNHSKIVAADGMRAVVGGHNLWAKDYLGSHPVHDVSGLIEGSAVGCVQTFCSDLWSRPSKIPVPQVLQNGKFSDLNETASLASATGYQVQPPPIENKGTTRMLSLGPLGFGIADQFSVATNASVSARVMALCRAKKTIRISQQSLYFTVVNVDGGFDLYTLWALVKAMQAGVNVQIVVSNEVPLSEGGYEGRLRIVLEALASLYVGDRLGIYRPSLNPPRDELGAWANASLNSPSRQLPLVVKRGSSQAECAPHLNELNSRLSLAPLYYAPNINYWQVGSERKFAANHAKVYIIDDTHFYVGSDNFYLSGTSHGLQEFGHLVEGQSETRDFIQNYWDKIWKNSGPHAVKASYSDLRFAVPGPPPFLPVGLGSATGDVV